MEKMKNCKACGKEIASSARVCPHCGAKNKKPLYKKWWFWAIAVIVVIGVATSSNNKTDVSPTVTTSTQENTQAEQNKEKITFEDVGYFKIENATGGGNRSYTVYTNSSDENEMIEYARKKMYSIGGFTYVHFYNDKNNTPDITLINPNTPELAYDPESSKEYRIFVYEKTPNENEFIWDGAMSESKSIN